MSSPEMKEFEDLTNVKDGAKDSLDRTNDAKSDIADLRRENTKGAEKVVNMKKAVSDSQAAQAIDIRQKQELASLSQVHRNDVGRLDSSTQMCLGGGINDMMNPDYFRDFLITAGESPDKQRPSYTLNKSNVTAQASEQVHRSTQQIRAGLNIQSFSDDFSGLQDLTNIRINSNRELNYDVNGESPISSSHDILTTNAMRGSEGIPNLGSISTGFQNVSLSKPKAEQVPDTKPKSTNRIASK
ncbi:MAG: hypothetical protein U0518_04085 [Candidatus Gracilibacteria bacterium]